MGYAALGVEIAALVVAAAGTGYSVYKSNQAANFQEDVAAENARVTRLAAADALERGAVAEQDRQRQVAALIGEQRSKYAALGVDPNEGSPLTVAADTKGLGTLDVLTIRGNARREAWGLEQSARGITFQGQNAAFSMRNSANASALMSAGSIVGQTAKFFPAGTTTTTPVGSIK